ncbi:MAG: PAS domain-containing protein, partial [Bacteroidota bacterium]
MIRPVESLSYEYLFKYSPIALWEIDFTNVLIYLEKIKEKGIPDIKHHLELFPDEFDECFRLLKIKQANEAALNFLEIDSVEELLDNDNSFLTSKTRLAYLELINGLYQNKKSFNFDTEVLSKSGNRKAVRINFNLIYTNNTAEHIGILTTEMLFDIRQQEEQFKETISISPDIIMINRISDGLFSYVNHTFKSKTGYSDEEIYHKSGLDLGFWVKQEERKIYFEAMNREGFVQDLPTTFRAKNGEQ